MRELELTLMWVCQLSRVYPGWAHIQLVLLAKHILCSLNSFFTHFKGQITQHSVHCFWSDEWTTDTQVNENAHLGHKLDKCIPFNQLAVIAVMNNYQQYDKPSF